MMQHPRPSLTAAAKRLTGALRRETDLARTGALQELADASEAKRAAFTEFDLACTGRDPKAPPSDSERGALRDLLHAADESALVLDAVRTTLAGFVRNIQKIASTLADPGTYAPAGQTARHVLAVQLDAAF